MQAISGAEDMVQPLAVPRQLPSAIWSRIGNTMPTLEHDPKFTNTKGVM